MDPDTQRLIERTRQRREMLNQRIAGMPEAAPRKRRTPVHENETSESDNITILTEKQNIQDDSPKRQCVRDIEQELKPDTPAVRGVQSRIKDLQNLPSSLNHGNSENTLEETPTPKPRKSISSPPLEKRTFGSGQKSCTKDSGNNTATSTRKGRFAALAQDINSWEDNLTHIIIQKEEEKKPKWQPPSKKDNPPAVEMVTSSGKGPAPSIPRSSALSKEAAKPNSPKKVHAPPTPRSNVSGTPASNLSRNSPLRSSKVEWNRSPKPFTATYEDNTSLVSKSATDLKKSIPSLGPVSPSKAVSDTSIPSSYKETSKAAPIISRVPSISPVNIPDKELNKAADDPTVKPVVQKFTTWAEKTETPKFKLADPSRQTLSAKLATFEKKITENRPRTGLAQSLNVPKTAKQVCTPALSASTPVPSSTTTSGTNVCDPTELPVSERMTQMQEKLSNTPQVRPKQDEPTAYSVGARMSAWETMTSSNLVSDIKKVNPGEVTPLPNKSRPVSAFTPTAATSQSVPLPPELKKVVTTKDFKESIEKKASEVWARKEVSTISQSKTNSAQVGSPVKTSLTSPSKIVHSPSKVSAGTKTVQQLLAEKCQDSSTTCSALAAQSRAERIAELEAIQSRWKNGLLNEDHSSSSDESMKSSGQTGSPSKIKSLVIQTTEPKTPGSSKRDNARNKARADFNSKLAQIGLVQDATSSKPTVPVPPPAPGGISLTPKFTPSSQTSSIYHLIKKREENPEDKKVKFNNSFEDSDDDDSERKIPRCVAKRAVLQAAQEEEEFKKPAAPVTKDESESDVPSSSDVGEEEFGSADRLPMDIDDDDISLKGFVSEAVRRESILPPPTATHASSQSSLDSCVDDRQAFDSEGSLGGMSSKHGGYRPDNESMDEYDEEENDRNAVGDLLDEALDNTSDDYDPDMDPKNVVLRRPKLEEKYDPDMDINNVVMRRKTTQPVPARRSHGRALDSNDDEDCRPYSLQEYRKSANVHQQLMEPVVRKSRYAGSLVQEEDISVPSAQQPYRDDKKALQAHIKELQELVQQEQNVIMQASNALNKCCMGNSYFAGSAEQVECNKILLIACQKRQCYMTEIQRMKETGCLSSEVQGPHGSLTISDIRLPLKKEFVTRIGTSHDTTTHYFILLIRNGAQLICTQMLSTHDPMMRGSLDFPNLIKINGITGNFKLILDIYGMSISKEMTLKDKKKKTPKKGKGHLPLESPGGPMAVRTTSFSQVTSLELTMKSLDKTSFHLDRLPYLSPLYGQIFMRLKCCMEVNIEERGFLTMFEDVSGFGAWHRRWCVLAGSKLCVWKYPDDETRKDPMAIIDLKRCITEKVGLVPRDICARPNTFEMVTVRQPLKGEHDTLISTTYNATTMVRYQMSADSKEERIVWCNKINRTLANLRTWNADAVKPTRPATGPSSSYHS